MSAIKNIENDLMLHEAIDADRAILYKHSTQCGVSAYALHQVEKFARKHDGDIPIYLVNVIENRLLSDKIAKHFGVHHQSPQIFLIKGGKQVWNVSHFRIRAVSLAKQVQSVFNASLQN